MEIIYYFKTFDGVWHFSTGITRTDEKVSQYLRMLGYAKKEVRRLYPDIPEDKAKICEVFGYRQDLTWQDIYNSIYE